MSWIYKAFATFAVTALLGVGGLGSLCIVGGHALTNEFGSIGAIEINGPLTESAFTTLAELVASTQADGNASFALSSFGDVRNGADGLRIS